ncbi:MAG: FtsQ-type POTRA domain-containing protein [Pseudomonadota bacterium]
MFSFRKTSTQAKRKSTPTESPSFEWRKSYNWIFAVIPLIALSAYVVQMDNVLPIRTIQISGTFKHLDQTEVESTLKRYLGEGFFSLDIHELQQHLNDRPWTESVSIRRIWPDKLRVTIVEKKPLARWDEQHLLSDQAQVFKASAHEFAHLPLINAASHRPDWVLNRFHQLAVRFENLDEQLVSLKVDSRGALSVQLINGLSIKFGRSDIDRKMDRLVKVYNDQILPRREQIQQLDLRYSNGFAVAWKKEVLQSQDKASLWSNSNV